MSYEHWGDSIINRPEDHYGDENTLGFSSDGYSVVGASVRGRMHIRNGVPREDAFAAYRSRHWLAVAVSDGVGASQYSRLGASLAVNRACQSLLYSIRALTLRKSIIPWGINRDALGADQMEQTMLESLRSVAHDLKEHAERLTATREPREELERDGTVGPILLDAQEELGADEAVEETVRTEGSSERKAEVPLGHSKITVDDLHCTLLTLMLNLKTGAMALAQIGDGLILGLTESLDAVPIIDPKMPGQTGQTYVITQRDWERYCSIKVMTGDRSREYATLYMMTDGVADDCQYGPPEDILQRWARDMDSEIRKYDVRTTEERLRTHLNEYHAKGSYDDRTLVAVYRGRA